MLRIVAISHNPAGLTVLTEKFLQSCPAVGFRVLCPFADDILPEQDAFDATIVFGGKITCHAKYIVEMGFYLLYPMVEGFNIIFVDMPERFFQWYSEDFSLPEGVMVLVASDALPNQAFALGGCASSFQFHPGAAAGQICYWHIRDSEDLAGSGAQAVTSQWLYQKRYGREIDLWPQNFLAFWLNGVAGGEVCDVA